MPGTDHRQPHRHGFHQYHGNSFTVTIGSGHTGQQKNMRTPVQGQNRVLIHRTGKMDPGTNPGFHRQMPQLISQRPIASNGVAPITLGMKILQGSDYTCMPFFFHQPADTQQFDFRGLIRPLSGRNKTFKVNSHMQHFGPLLRASHFEKF